MELLVILVIVLLMTGMAGIGLFYSTLYRHPFADRCQTDELMWSMKQRRKSPPDVIWLQYYQTGHPRVTWTSLEFLVNHHDDVKYIRSDLWQSSGKTL